MTRKHPCPYSFPAKSRKAMTDYILDRKGYSDHYTPFPFIWNVKAHSVNWDKPKGDYETLPEFDAAWSKEVQSAWRYQSALEAAQSYYVDEWCSYPGHDQGDWKFGFYGRQGGHLCLEEWHGWRSSKLYGRDFDLTGWLQELPFTRLQAFYRAVVCMDQDFTREAACRNVEYDLNLQRHEWEQEQLAEREAASIAFAQAYEASRPDLYEVRT